MTPKTLADALDCFWNAAAGAARDRQSLNAIEVSDVLTAGVSAVAVRLLEHGEERDRRIDELLEANNRYQQGARDARAALIAILDTSGARGEYHALNYAAAVERAEALLAGKVPAAIPAGPRSTSIVCPKPDDLAFASGWNDYCRGAAVSQNPYLIDDQPAHGRWIDGFKSAFEAGA